VVTSLLRNEDFANLWGKENSINRTEKVEVGKMDQEEEEEEISLEAGSNEKEEEESEVTQESEEAKEDIKVIEKSLTKELMAAGLSQLNRTLDGLSHAFVRFEAKEKELTNIEMIRNFQHLRHVDLSKNKLLHFDPLKDLSCLVTLNLENNLIETFTFGSRKC
jgi:Leucine-rich repeat (LRR) protein